MSVLHVYIHRYSHVVKDNEWREADHPRGQPGNPGQFGPGSGGNEVGEKHFHNNHERQAEITREYNLSDKDIKMLKALGTGGEGDEHAEHKDSYEGILESDELKNTLRKLPQVKRDVYRGMPMSAGQVSQFKEGGTYKFPVNSFVAPNLEYAKSYSEGEEDTVPVLLKIEGAKAANFSATGFSSGHSTEYVIPKDTEIKITSVSRNSDGDLIVVGQYEDDTPASAPRNPYAFGPNRRSWERGLKWTGKSPAHESVAFFEGLAARKKI